MRSILAILALLFSFNWAMAQDDMPTPDQQNYQALDAWLRIAETQRRCGSLFFFETRAIEKNVRDRINATPEAKAAYANAGSAQFDAAFKKQTDMLQARRQAAREATADTVCDGFQNPELAQARRLYFNDFMKLILIVDAEKSNQTLSTAQKVALSDMFNFIKQAYGDQFEAVVNNLISQVNANPPNAGVALDVLRPYIDDLVWQHQLRERGYTMAPNSFEPGWMEFRKDASPHATYGKFGRPAKRLIMFDEDTRIPAFVSRGQLLDGRIALVISYESTTIAETVDEVKATIFSQNREQLGEWDLSNWRTRSTAFDSRRDDTEACPGHICLIFPAALSDRIRTRQAAGNDSYPYELYLAGEKLHPAPLESSRGTRIRYSPPGLAAN